MLQFEPLVVGIFAILPGFLSASARSVLVARERFTATEWTMTSVVTSLFLNALVLLATLICIDQGALLGAEVSELKKRFNSTPASAVLIYLGVLYGLAVLWGVVSGLAQKYSPSHLVFLTKLTPISPEPDVFHLALGSKFRSKNNLNKRNQDDMQVPWVKLKTDMGDMLGRLRSSSVLIERDKPFEVFLEPAFIFKDGNPQPVNAVNGSQFVGTYVKVRPENTLQVFSAPVKWTPEL